MPITQTDYNELEAQKKGYLEISAYDYYFNKVRPHMKDMLMKCRTDEELTRTLDKVLNAGDSFCQRKDYIMLAESFNVLETAITDKNYFNGVMKKASEEERQMVRDLISKISDLRMLIKCEVIEPKKETKIRDRIDYNSPVGENEGYSTHNMKELSKPNPRKRIPNV